MSIFRIWVVILAFVSSQLAWNLRPFVGGRDMPFELFRAREGNFYVAVIHSVANLFEPTNKTGLEKQDKVLKQQPDSTSNKTYVE